MVRSGSATKGDLGRQWSRIGTASADLGPNLAASGPTLVKFVQARLRTSNRPSFACLRAKLGRSSSNPGSPRIVSGSWLAGGAVLVQDTCGAEIAQDRFWCRVGLDTGGAELARDMGRRGGNSDDPDLAGFGTDRLRFGQHDTDIGPTWLLAKLSSGLALARCKHRCTIMSAELVAAHRAPARLASRRALRTPWPDVSALARLCAPSERYPRVSAQELLEPARPPAIPPTPAPARARRARPPTPARAQARPPTPPPAPAPTRARAHPRSPALARLPACAMATGVAPDVVRISCTTFRW